MTLSIVLVHYHDEDRLLRLLRSLPAHLGPIDAEVVVIDNGSRDGFGARVREASPGVRYRRNDSNRGFAAGVNQGARQARGEYLCILNPDVELEGAFFAPQLSALRARPDVAVVGPAVARADGRRQRTAHRRFPTRWTVFVEYCLPLQVAISRWLPSLHPHDEDDRAHARSHGTAHLTGVSLLTRREEFLRTGGFDERYFLYLEETDWQRTLAARGRTAWYCAEARCRHFGSIDRRFAAGTAAFLRGLFRYWAKWRGRRAVAGLRIAVGGAALFSLFALLPLRLLGLLVPRFGPKVRVFVSGELTALRWAVRSDPTA